MAGTENPVNFLWSPGSFFYVGMKPGLAASPFSAHIRREVLMDIKVVPFLQTGLVPQGGSQPPFLRKQPSAWQHDRAVGLCIPDPGDPDPKAAPISSTPPCLFHGESPRNTLQRFKNVQ